MLDREHISFNGDENQYVNFKILKQSKPGRAEAYIFITDTNELFNQAVALEIIILTKIFKFFFLFKLYFYLIFSLIIF